jgi:HSP20 family molecular chaperone IbpA
MTDATQNIQVKEKQEATTPAEQTQAGLVFTPAVDIFETEKDITLVADMPGVKNDQLTIDLKEDTLTLSGDVTPFEGADETDILIEYEIGKFFRQFTLSNVIDRDKIEATLKDGVLRLNLPKVDRATPRKINVNAG